jgi:cellulose synthase/poly-beta-1,6-N-acetylglucosamine synthase-like glycosyltransferase
LLPVGSGQVFSLQAITLPGGQLMTAFIICVATVNLIRMMLYLVGAGVYTLRRALSKDRALPYQPTVSLVVPVHNEAVVIERTLDCLIKLDYAPLQIILADDGSTDDTVDRIYAYKRAHDPGDVLQVFTQQPNGGKAHVLNQAIRAMATGELVMCLDGDSVLAPDAVTKAVAHFRDPRIVASSSNVSILPNGRLLGLVQRYEYLICHQMKKAHNAFNVEYIIGGIGSMFRRSVLDEVGSYDTNTMTEDIDLTLKIIARKGSRGRSIAFAHDSVAYTEAVPSFRSLVRQRYRWKYGRLQTFYKNYRLFFSRDEKHSRVLSWFFLPFALWQEVVYLIEPVIVTVVVAITIYYRSPATLLSAMIIVSGYVIFNILGTVHLSRRDKALLSLMAPLMYVFLYILSVVEYIALLHAIVRLPRLRKSISGEQVTWISPERTGQLKGGRHRAEQVAA